MSTYRSFDDILEESLQDPETRAEWDRTALARDVSTWLLRYRHDHHLTQAALAELLGWKQPVVARLESGEHEPSLSTLHHLVERLGAAARVQIEPDGVYVQFLKRRRARRNINAVAMSDVVRPLRTKADALQPA
ncbi:MAG: helix-turn-helix transcriptional regulator [Chloroflexi bacterium]|nr:helix-turn-helix transcriptional regulator [Chloroflexota bacterium]MBV9895280.1 helix-turn-helix transcriptional regulator [Chloroflexota bacterium]